MFGDALLDSSPARASVLRRVHYLLSGLAGVALFFLGLYLSPILLFSPSSRASILTAAVIGLCGALDTLMICYVWADSRRAGLSGGLWLAIAGLLSLLGFAIYLVYCAWKTGDWKRAAIPLAYAMNSLALGAMVLVPLFQTEALPPQVTFIPLPPMAPRAPSTPPGEQRPMAVPQRPHVNMLTAPSQIPRTIPRIRDISEPILNAVVGDPSRVPTGGPGIGDTGVIGGRFDIGPPPPPLAPSATKPTGPKLVRVGIGVIAAMATYQPSPIYPPLATQIHLEGTVVLQAVIATGGTIKDLKVLRGQPFLANAALNAVKEWRYRPTFLNGEPVEVLTEINVNFKLAE